MPEFGAKEVEVEVDASGVEVLSLEVPLPFVAGEGFPLPESVGVEDPLDLPTLFSSNFLKL